ISYVDFILYQIGPVVHFLDLTLKVVQTKGNDAKIVTEIYYKPTDLRVLLHYNSAHSVSVRHAVVYGQLLRIFRLCSDVATAARYTKEFLLLMRIVHALPHRSMRKIWNRFLIKFRSGMKREQSELAECTFLRIPHVFTSSAARKDM